VRHSTKVGTVAAPQANQQAKFERAAGMKFLDTDFKVKGKYIGLSLKMGIS
jgi:hypothetical protein